MIKRIFIFSKILMVIQINCFAKVFVPSGDGFIEKVVNVEKETVPNVCEYLGYNFEQSYVYMDFDKWGGEVFAVAFEVFTESIICVITIDELASLSYEKVNDYLIKFSFENEYNASNTESILNKGIINRTLTSNFFEDIFLKSSIDKNGSFIIPEIGYELHFTNGILTRFNSTDGLNKWAKEWKSTNMTLFLKYEESAKKYWGNNNAKILNEINVQADAYSRIPKNEYIEFHRNKEGMINYKMLLVAHFNEKINLTEFKEINFGRYEFIDEFNDVSGYIRTTYRINKVLFTFDKNGKLVNSYTMK